MALVTLLRMGTSDEEKAAWRFEHAMAHRNYLAAMPNLPQFSVLPYFIDTPNFGNAKSLLNHQQAHNDFLANLPSFPQSFIGTTGFPSDMPMGIGMAQNLYDTTGNKEWWLFANHMEHLQAAANLPAAAGWIYPFW